MNLKHYLLLFIFICTHQAKASVDLHMHLTMDVALAPFYKGSLNDTAAATSWESRLKSRIDFEQLEKSQLQLIVAVIYINPVWGDIEKQFEEQINNLKKYTELHPTWKIVQSPEQAQIEISKKNKIIILSLEGAWFFLEPILFDRLISKHRISIVTPLHFSDFSRKIGKSAEQRGLFAPLQDILDFFKPFKFKALSPEGEKLFQYLIHKKIWIDLSHSSEQVVDYFFEIRPANYPLLMTHTVLKKYYGTDRGINEKILHIVKSEGGVIGLLPSIEMLTKTPIKVGDCIQGNPFLVQWNELVSFVGLNNVYLGSDMNSPIPGIPPIGGNSKCPILPDGLRTAADLKTLAEIQDKNAIFHFLEKWKQMKMSEPRM